MKNQYSKYKHADGQRVHSATEVRSIASGHTGTIGGILGKMMMMPNNGKNTTASQKEKRMRRNHAVKRT